MAYFKEYRGSYRKLGDIYGEVLSKDDKEDFIAMIDGEEDKPVVCPPELLSLAISCHAVKCVTALVEGETSFKVDFTASPSWGLPPLHDAAQSCCSGVIWLFLNHGVRTDVRFSSDIYKDVLPINAVLNTLRESMEFKKWTPKQSIFKLLFKLCLPTEKDALKTVRLLAFCTKDIKDEIFHYMEGAKVFELTVLLMGAPEMVFCRSMFRNRCGLDADMTIRQFITNKIVALADKELELVNGAGNSDLLQLCEQEKMALKATWQVFELFERLGDTIRAYVLLKKSLYVPVRQVAKEVTSLLTEAGYVVDYADFDLRSGDFDGPYLTVKAFVEPQRYKPQPLAVEHCFPQGSFQPGGQMDMRKQNGEGKVVNGCDEKIDTTNEQSGLTLKWHVHEESRALFSTVRHFHMMRDKKASMGFKSAISAEAQVVKTTNAVELYLPNFQSGKQCASSALAIKRGIRRILHV